MPRAERPYMLSIYLSAPAFNLASMVSYNHFSFLWHIRLSAVTGEEGAEPVVTCSESRIGLGATSGAIDAWMSDA